MLSNNYVTDTETFQELAHQLRLMKTCYSKFYTVFPFPKYSPYTRYVNDQLGRYIDAGIVDYWFKLMSIKHGKSYMARFFDKKEYFERNSPTPLKLSNVIGAFILLGCGLGLSTIVYLLELFVWNRRSKRVPFNKKPELLFPIPVSRRPLKRRLHIRKR